MFMEEHKLCEQINAHFMFSKSKTQYYKDDNSV